MSDHAIENARAWLETMKAQLAALDAGEEYEGRDASEAIQESPLSVEIRSEWQTPGSKCPGGQYKILLSTGGPALQIFGDLTEHAEPDSAALQWQDWGTPWTDLELSDDDREIVRQWAQQFYFEEA